MLQFSNKIPYQCAIYFLLPLNSHFLRVQIAEAAANHQPPPAAQHPKKRLLSCPSPKYNSQRTHQTNHARAATQTPKSNTHARGNSVQKQREWLRGDRPQHDSIQKFKAFKTTGMIGT